MNLMINLLIIWYKLLNDEFILNHPYNSSIDELNDEFNEHYVSFSNDNNNSWELTLLFLESLDRKISGLKINFHSLHPSQAMES